MTLQNSDKIYHQNIEDLSKNNCKIIDKIHSNKNIELANQLLAQAYLFLNTYHRSCLNFEGFKFSCHWCKGCEGCQSEDGYCSKYCLHSDDCEFSKFIIEKIETIFIEKNKTTEICDHNWVMDGHNAGDPICSKCYKRE